MRLLIFTILVCKNLTIASQHPYAENLWTSALINFKTKKISFTGDAGYRLCNQFVHSPRTHLVRMTIDYSINNLHKIGMGYAYFEHFSSLNSSENRYFIQYIASMETKKATINLRFRNELRTYNNRSTGDRTRIQATINKKLSSNFSAQVGGELFYTPGKNALFEQRYSIGLTTKISSHFKILTFYTTQFQSTISYLQNIVGCQLHWTFENIQ